MPTIKETFILSLTYEMSVDTETGEILETKLIDRNVNKPVKAMKTIQKETIQDEEPKLYLEDNKCKLNSAAVALMGISPGDKLDIKYDEGKNGSIPILGTDDAFGTKGGKYLKFCRLYEKSYRGLEDNIGELCDENTEITKESNES